MRSSTRSSTRSGAGGFTLVEVMLALAILGMALLMLMRSATSSLFATSQAQMLGIVTDLARAKMYDLEELLQKDGFSDSDRTEEGTFEAEGWESVEWKATIESVELPNFQTMAEVGKQATSDGGKAIGERFGVPSPGGAGSAAGSTTEKPKDMTSGFIEQFYEPISRVLKLSVRRVSLDLKWTVLGKERDLKVVTYVTDPSKAEQAVQAVMGLLGGGGGEEGGGTSGGAGGGTGGTGGKP
ncbi:MAG TPA: type II secretion system protein [Kofleriaceae bacterium]|nr:type II secretion system protein [Kofleriaceae bacterium]